MIQPKDANDAAEDTKMGRAFQQLKLSREDCGGLRESLRPLTPVLYDQTILIDLCERLYLAFYHLESDPDLATIDFAVTVEDLMLINHFVSAEEGGWAKGLLHQTRQALYELRSNKEAVRLASAQDTARLLDGIPIDLEMPDTGVKE